MALDDLPISAYFVPVAWMHLGQVHNQSLNPDMQLYSLDCQTG